MHTCVTPLVMICFSLMPCRVHYCTLYTTTPSVSSRKPSRISPVIRRAALPSSQWLVSVVTCVASTRPSSAARLCGTGESVTWTNSSQTSVHRSIHHRDGNYSVLLPKRSAYPLLLETRTLRATDYKKASVDEICALRE